MLCRAAAQRGAAALLRCRRPLTPFGPSRSSSSSSSSHGKPPRPGQWALTVSPFTTVRAQLGCSLSIQPLDPHAFPEADRAFIAVNGPAGTEQQQAGPDRLHVRYDEESRELLISALEVDRDLSIEVAAPIKSNLFITAQGEGSVQVRKMECDICKVQIERGHCLLHSVKGHHVEVQSCGGRVTGAGTIHGNVSIRARGDGAVDVKKLQGTSMDVSTEHGPLKVKAIYAESSCVSSCSGRVELGHVHGNTTVKNQSGDTVIDGSNSLVKVSSLSGGIDVYVGDGGSAELHSQEGAVSVRVPSSLRAGVEARGVSVDISPEVVLHGVVNNSTEGHTTVTGYMNADPPVDRWVKAQADRGPVTLRTQSWFETLRLGG
ncbi:protein FAM185A [Salarias fasciatus]|uniref:DUF4097 domain-containing protein n=1 Tax=Salarias fasciatus TaxID=181472 RepID=A0A672FGI9_SALFA|nr:protein FAM185A [Salarias fasciatus]